MKLLIKLGNIYRDDTWERSTHHETDEQWEEETNNLETAKKRLEKEFRIYKIEERTNKIVAWVY